MRNELIESELYRIHRTQRHNSLNQRRYQSTLNDQLNQKLSRLQKITTESNLVVRNIGPSLTAFAYRGGHLIYPYLETIESLPSLIEQTQAEEFNHDQVNTVFKDHNFFTEKIGGTAIDDLKEMDLPLSAGDIRKLDRMIREGLLYRPSRRESDVAVEMVLLALRGALDHWRGNIPSCPQQLRPYRDCLLDYFDNYADCLLDPAVTNHQFELANARMMWKQKTLFPALGGFIPARLGLTPSSATKLLEERYRRSGLAKTTSEGIITWMTRETKEAYYNDFLPKELQEYQHYYPETDEKAAALVKEHYPQQDSNLTDGAAESAELAGLLEKVPLYFQKLTESLISGKRRILKVSLPENSVGCSLWLSTQNRLNLIMLLRLPEGSHLLLEMNRRGSIYGLPFQLTLGAPRSVNPLLLDILPPVLAELRKEFPTVEPKPNLAGKLEISPASVAPKGILPLRGEGVVQEPQSFRQRMKMAVDVLLDKNVDVPQGPQVQVDYDIDKIIRDLGKNAQVEDISRIVAVIKRFESGSARVKSLVVSAEGQVELRAGRYRILLLPGKGGWYEYHLVLPRKELDSRKALDRITV